VPNAGAAIKMQISSGHVMMLQFNLAHINTQRKQTGREQRTDTNSTAATASSATFAFEKPNKKKTKMVALTLFWPFLFHFPISSLSFWPSDILGQLSHLFSVRCFVFSLCFSANFRL